MRASTKSLFIGGLAALAAMTWVLPRASRAEEPAPAAADVEAAPITKMPTLEHFVEAAYPERAQAEGLEATVLLELEISAAGDVEAVRVVEPAVPAGYGFDEAAVDAARAFHFTPAEAGGEPIPVVITYRYGFVLKAAPKPVEHVPVVRLRGRLLERGTRTPLVGVAVTVFRGEGESAHGIDTRSDEHGVFELYDLEPGEWKVLCDPPGYYPLRTAETIPEGEALEVTYYLEKRSYSPFDVMVEAPRPRKEVTRTTVTTEEIDKVPGTFGDPIAVVTNLPSVARMPIGSGGVVVRGSSPQDTLTLVDGIDVPYLYHFGGIRTALPAGMLEAIDFYPGNFGASYGRAMGGVLDIQLKELRPTRTTGVLDTSFIDTSVFIATPVGESGAVAIGGRRSYIDVLLNQMLAGNDAVELTVAPRYYDYQALASYRPAPGHEVSLAFFGSDDSFAAVFGNPADAAGVDYPSLSMTSHFDRAILTHAWHFGEGASNELKLTFGRDTEDTELGTDHYIRSTVLSTQLRDTLSVPLRPGLVLTSGLDLVAYRASWDVSFRRPPVEGDTPAENASFDTGGLLKTKRGPEPFYLPAAFVQLEWTLADSLLVIPALRVDYFDVVEQTVWDPRLTVRWRLDDAWVLKGAAGVFHQPPTIDQIDAGFGNPALGSQWAYHYALGAEVRASSTLNLDVNGFYKDMRHLVVVSDGVVERDGELVPERYNNRGRGRVYGVDFLVRHEFANNFFGWLAYTVSRSERKDNRSGGYRLFDYDQTHILTALGSYRLAHNWELGVRWRYVSGNPYTPVTGSVLDMDADQYLPVAGRTNSDRQPSFQQLDVRLDKRWVYRAWMFSAYIDVQNLFNRQNAEAWGYNYDFSQREPVSSMSFITIFGLRAEI